MKNTIQIPVPLTIIFLLLLSVVLFAAKPKPNSTTCLKLNGLMLKSSKTEKGIYKIELLQYNTIIDSLRTTNNKPFEFSLAKNSWYTLRITKEGFFPLLISVDTELPYQNSELYEFRFQTELLPLNENMFDKQSLDLPVGVVTFDKINDRFYPAENYKAYIAGSF